MSDDLLLGNIAFWAIYFWLLYHSPFLQWVSKLILLLGWGVMTAGAVLYVIIVVYLPKHEYGAAVAALVVGSVLYVPWIIVGFPEISKTLRAGKQGLRLWKQ